MCVGRSFLFCGAISGWTACFRLMTLAWVLWVLWDAAALEFVSDIAVRYTMQDAPSSADRREVAPSFPFCAEVDSSDRATHSFDRENALLTGVSWAELRFPISFYYHLGEHNETSRAVPWQGLGVQVDERAQDSPREILALAVFLLDLTPSTSAFGLAIH